MPAFSYTAVDAEGRTRRGIVEAEAPRQARADLRSEGLVPLELAPVDAETPTAGAARWFGRRHRLGAGEVALLTRRLALLLEAGLTVEQSLSALIEQAETDETRRILAAVRAEVMSGHSLSTALERYPSSFPDIYRALVSTGEHSGELSAVMTRLADYLEAREAVRQSAGLALLYPAIVAVVALLIVAGLLTYVVPQVVQVFEQSRQALPLLTRVMLATSGFLRSNIVYIGLALVGLGFLLRAAYARETVRARWHTFVLRLPVLGKLAQGADTARLASTLAILVGSGVPLLQALVAGARVTRSLPLRQAVEDAAQQVREGTSLHRALARRKLFPAIFIHLVASGEASGRLAHMLNQAARQQEAENAARIGVLTRIFEPAVIVALGLLVLLVVLAILLPIIEMNALVRV
jgi:general secretion pathway protein F